MYARIIDGQVAAIGPLPPSARRRDTGELVAGLEDASAELREATGWLEVLERPRPSDTDTTTHDRAVVVVDGAPVLDWIERQMSDEELAAATAERNLSAVRSAVRDHLATLRTIRDSSGRLTADQLSDAVRVLAAGQIRLARLALDDLDGTA